MNSKSDAMKELDEAILGCHLCKLAEGRTNAVPGSGLVQNVEVVFVGEGPGRNEDREGKPFVGAGGKLLDELLRNAGLDRDQVYITNIVKCRPPNNRKPEDDEVETCTSTYLERQLAILKPLLVCTLGATALEYFTGKNKMGESHGKLTKTKNGIPLLPTYHPAAIFRNQSYRELLQEDLKTIPEVLTNLKKASRQKQTTLTSY
ncbi:MAG: uracil-DNA glycosylase [Nitrososphaerales archaeon]